jgi:ribosomal-protein-alanine N-acetyltransferase
MDGLKPPCTPNEHKRVKNIIAHTLGEENASTKVLTKCGFRKVEEINDPEDGVIW